MPIRHNVIITKLIRSSNQKWEANLRIRSSSCISTLEKWGAEFEEAIHVMSGLSSCNENQQQTE